MKSLRILHLASFAGNIGDVESQKSFRNWLKHLLPEREIKWENFEIRRFYRSDTVARNEFFCSLESSDLLVIGGGNFLELWPNNTPSGTSLPFSAEELIASGIPIFFNSVGVDNGQGFGEISQEKFRHFINSLLSNGKVFLTVRNDGSKNTIKNFLEDGHKTRCLKLPDHGFFALPQYRFRPRETNIVGINIAIDMPNIRFRNFGNSSKQFLVAFARTLEKVHNSHPQITFRLIPHMYSDLSAYGVLLENLTDQLRRENVQVSKYDVSFSSNAAQEAYHDLSALIAMRFHSNVFGISMGIPTLSLETYPQITKLLDEMNVKAKDRYLMFVSNSNLYEQIALFLKDHENGKTAKGLERNKRYMMEISEQRLKTGTVLKKWIYEEVENHKSTDL